MEDRAATRNESAKLPRKLNVKRKRKFRKLRRGCRGKNKKKGESVKSDEFKILHSNIRGFLSKKTSLVDNVKKCQADVICLNEHGLRGRNKVNIPGYFTLSKN